MDMHRQVSTNFVVTSMLVDDASIMLSIFLTGSSTSPALSLHWVIYLSAMIIWIVIFVVMGVYDETIRIEGARFWARILSGIILADVLISMLLIATGADGTYQFLPVFVTTTLVATITWRLILAVIVKIAGPDHWTRPLLIVGTTPKARNLLAKIRQRQILGFKALGLVSAGDQDPGSGEEILGGMKDIRQLIQAYSVRDLIITLPTGKKFHIDSILIKVGDLPVQVWAFPDYLEAAVNTKQSERWLNWPFSRVYTSTLNSRQRLVKRCFDLAISILLLPFSLIVMGIIALAVRLEGPGPIFFSQIRVGENGKLFELFKIRTMFPHADDYRYLVEHYDEHGNFIHKSENDPRVTRIGRFLRKTSLDELPQLFNVLLGSMSIVGPRPELPYLVEQYQPWQRKRFAVPPGLTCLWQVNGRSNRPMHLHTEDDIFYIDHYSFRLDLKIVLKTIAVVVRGRGAY